MNKKSILVDMDSTLYNFIDPLEQRLGEIWNTLEFSNQVPFLGKEHWTNFDIWKCFAQDPEIRKRIITVVESTYQNYDFFASLQLYPHAKEIIQELKQHYRVAVCTTPSGKNFGCEQAKRFTLERDFDSDFARYAVFAKDKTLVRGDVLIDDKPDIDVGIYEPTRKHIIYKQKFNLSQIGVKPSVQRSDGFEAIQETIEQAFLNN